MSPALRGLMRRPQREGRPYPDPFSPSERAVIEAVLHQGVAALVEAGDLDMTISGEVHITNELEKLLNRMLESEPPVVQGFTKALFQTVVRGAELADVAGTHLEKRPDLAFRSTRRLPSLGHPEQCVLLVECKIADRNHPVASYCSEGIKRFVDGTYAWAVAYGMMLGYSRDGFLPEVQLRTHLDKYGNRYGTVGHLRQRDPGASEPHWFVSVHDRRIPGMPSSAKGRVTLFHLWVCIP